MALAFAPPGLFPFLGVLLTPHLLGYQGIVKMTTTNHKKNEGGKWMVSLDDVAYLKWDAEKAEILDHLMDNAKPKKLSGRKLADLVAERGYAANYYTIHKMRTGRQDHVLPETVVGICEVFNLELDHFMNGLFVKSKKL